MLAHPRLKANLRASTVESRALFLMGEHSELVFEGPSYVALAGLLDGRRNVGEVLGEASKHVPWPVAYAALGSMERKGCLIDGEPLSDAGQAAFWDGLSVEAVRVQAALDANPLSLIALKTEGPVQSPDLSLEPFRRAFAGVGLREAEGGLQVVVTPDYLLPELGPLNVAALAHDRPWLLVKPTGTILLVGPLFVPGKTGCWACLSHRLTFNRQVERYASRRTGRPMPLSVARGWIPSSQGLAASLAATELARALVVGGDASVVGRVVSFDLARRQLEGHVLVRRPQCPVCGDSRLGLRGPGPIALERRPKADLAPGAERGSSAAEVFERYKHHVSAITGIVTALTAREPGDYGLTHSYVAGHYFPMTSDEMSALRVNLVARSGGKGRNELQAKTGALCEALERTSGIAWGNEPVRLSTYRALGPEAVPIRELAPFSEAQYAARDLFNAENVSEYHDVPPRFDENAEISWSPAWSLTHHRLRYLPTAYCFYGFRDPGQFFTRCDSNGCAAGGSLEEAILYGLLELVERDAVAIWWYSRVRRPELDADGFGIARWAELKRHYGETLGRDLHAIDLTTDLGIPTVGVVSRCRDRAVEDIIVGFAAHVDPVVALSRALEEANQYLPSVRERAPDGSTVYRLFSEETVRWWKTATYANQPYLVGNPNSPPRTLAEMPNLSTDDVAADVEACVRAVERCGLEVLVIDQTRPDIGLPVARVVVPGLRHFWRRLGPGRLYDVPVKLGWLPAPIAEQDLNPISCFV